MLHVDTDIIPMTPGPLVLVVDDEEGPRNAITRMLQELGYHARSCSSGPAALGFLGVGLNPPASSLGSILNSSVVYALPDPAYFLFPGLAVVFVVLSFNLLGDGLRDALDPKSGRS